MKRIGIVTFYESDNYGTCLQAFAISHAIQSLGYCAEIVNYQRDSIISQLSILKKLSGVTIQQAIQLMQSKKYRELRKQGFIEFRKLMLISQQRYYEENLIKANEEYDAFVCGSDMVWSLESKKLFDVYFLTFAEKEKRIAYAPSFGNMVFSENDQALYAEKLLGFDYLSCREKTGVEFIEKTINKNCQFVLDPTLLLDKEDWLKTFQINYTDDSKNKKLLSYMFGGLPPQIEKKLNKLLGDEYQMQYIPDTLKEYKRANISNATEFGPIGFIKQYATADKVVTNTYHGLIFAIIFNKPFVLVHRPKKEHWAIHEERMASFLKTFDLESHYVYADQEITEDMFPVDYEKVNRILKEYRHNSLLYLSGSLCEVVKGTSE